MQKVWLHQDYSIISIYSQQHLVYTHKLELRRQVALVKKYTKITNILQLLIHEDFMDLLIKRLLSTTYVY